MNNDIKTGLVLEGGGMRSLFTAGILDVMMEAGIQFDGIIGVSAGATFGCNYKSRQIGRTLRYNLRYANDWRYCSLRSLLKTGDLVGAEFAYHTLPTELDVFDNQTYQHNPTRFCVVCTDAVEGKPVYHYIDTFDHTGLEWLRASASLPIVSRPVKVDGYTLLDGGITDSIPLRHWQEEGYRRNIVILTQPSGYKKKLTKLMPLFRLFTRRYPAIIQAMQRRHHMYNAQLDYLAQEQQKGDTLVICPPNTLAIGRTEMDTHKMQQIYDQGRACGLEHLSEIKKFINNE